jgi:hypothetical protein
MHDEPAQQSSGLAAQPNPGLMQHLPAAQSRAEPKSYPQQSE